MSALRLWYVVTPNFEYTEVILDGQGPTYDVCDLIEIEAETARDAVLLGVKEMLRGSRQEGSPFRRFTWCLEQRADGLSPYAGVKAHAADEAESAEQDGATP